MKQGVIDYKRQIAQGVIGFLMGRVFLYSMNPFAVAYFVTACAEKRGKAVVMATVLAGMITVEDGTNLLKYILLFSLVGFLDFMKQKAGKKKAGVFELAVITSVFCMVLGVAGSVMSYQTKEMLALSLLESISVLALANVFQWGIRFLLYESMNKVLGNEELISLLAVSTIALCGLPRYFDGFFSVAETVSYFILLYIGYRYGASAGAIAGASGGILAALSGAGAASIGLYCLLGIGVGMFREAGKLISSLAFLIMGVILAFVFQEEIMGIVELRGIVSAMIVFLAIPKSSLQIIDIDYEKGEENSFAKEDIRALANYKIEDFSGAFRRLAKSFNRAAEVEEGLTSAQIQGIFDDLSEGICKNCTNCSYCWEKNYESTRNDIQGILQTAGERGSIAPEDVKESFGSQCIHFPDYIKRVNQNMRTVHMNMSFQNKMAESRRALGSQMQEVAGMLGDFSKELSHVKERGKEEKRAIALALRQAGLIVKKLSVNERRHDMIEVQFEGRAKGKNCVTKRDVAECLKRATGIRFRGVGETKNVIGREFETIRFAQDTNFKTLTGLARVAKSGEQVSGDNFSFLELGTGELLMVLSDGMGSGNEACQDSEALVNVLEDLLEVGFQKESAIRMLNSFFVLSYEGRTFTTLDMTSINLYTGECEFLKNGAAATFVKRKDRVEIIVSSALPVGVELQAQTTSERTVLQDGDLVVMVTDGILDAFPGEDKEFYVQNILENTNSSNPSDIANRILMQALERSAHLAPDDMSVLAAGVWDKA